MASITRIVEFCGVAGGVSACRRDRRAVWQRLATAWWARRHNDHPMRNSCRASGSAIASTNRLTSGTVSGIRCEQRSPFY
jgi:hypothetical protein